MWDTSLMLKMHFSSSSWATCQRNVVSPGVYWRKSPPDINNFIKFWNYFSTWTNFLSCLHVTHSLRLNLSPSGPAPLADLFHHLQPRMTLIPSPRPHLIHLPQLSIVCHCNKMTMIHTAHYKDKRSTRSGLCLHKEKKCGRNLALRAGNSAAHSLTRHPETEPAEVCTRIPLKCTTENEIWGSPVKNHACNHLSSPLSLSAEDLEEALVPLPPCPSTSPL